MAEEPRPSEPDGQFCTLGLELELRADESAHVAPARGCCCFPRPRARGWTAVCGCSDPAGQQGAPIVVQRASLTLPVLEGGRVPVLYQNPIPALQGVAAPEAGAARGVLAQTGVNVKERQQVNVALRVYFQRFSRPATAARTWAARTMTERNSRDSPFHHVFTQTPRWRRDKHKKVRGCFIWFSKTLGPPRLMMASREREEENEIEGRRE